MFTASPSVHSSQVPEGFYTIQVGTYTPAALKYARKQFDFLYRELGNHERYYLRIERGSKYYIVRLGRFEGITAARKLLETIKILVPDAFILKEKNFEKSKVVKLNEKPSAASDEYYTLQIGNFLKQEQALEEVDALKRILPDNALGNLRTEKIGRYFSVRLGKFPDYTAAKKFLEHIDNMIVGAVLLKSYQNDEQIIDMFSKPAQPAIPSADGGKAPGEDIPDGAVPLNTGAGTEKESVDVLFSEIATRYYDRQYGDAAELIRKGIAQWPDNPDLYAWYGTTLLDMRFPDKAYEQYRKAVDLSPDVPDYHAGVGYSLIGIYMDKAARSIEAFGKALEIDPDNVGALEGIGIAYVSIDKKDLAADIYNRLKTLDDEAAGRLNEIMTYGLDWGEQ